ncbi:MAG: VacJ family lipoprotein [Woeseiaceae bacterium]|nr:VacJ family lipoprotein [Woeseiaceae bacterium]
MHAKAQLGAALAAVAFLAGCSSQNISNVEHDPLEGFNRGVYAVNDATDRVLVKPLARGYKAITPRFARRSVSNFFDNLVTPRSSLNNFLQGKPGRGFSDLGRFAMNSTFGVGGLFDVATSAGLEATDEDFGQTLAVWGVAPGPYVVLPMLGPRTLRDTIAMPVDFLADPTYHYDETSVKDKLRVLQIINLRARLLAADALLEESNDPYITLRESYLQNREYEIYDGDPPLDDDFYDEFDDEFFDEEEPTD